MTYEEAKAEAIESLYKSGVTKGCDPLCIEAQINEHHSECENATLIAHAGT